MPNPPEEKPTRLQRLFSKKGPAGADLEQEINLKPGRSALDLGVDPMKGKTPEQTMTEGPRPLNQPMTKPPSEEELSQERVKDQVSSKEHSAAPRGLTLTDMEYDTANVPDYNDPKTMLNLRGEKGWRLVAAIHVGNNIRYIYERMVWKKNPDSQSNT